MEVDTLTGLLSKVTRVRDIWSMTTGFFSERGVERMSYHHIPPPGAVDGDEVRVAATGFPEEWVRRYVSEKLYLIDPITTFAKQATEPFFWTDIRNLRDISSEEQRYLELLEEEALGDGLGLQVFGPYGRNGYCGLGFGSDCGRLSALTIREYQWVCQLAHLKYCDILTTRLEKAPSLTAREIEVLGWVARGKSNGVIAEILGVSPHTVDAYLRRIFLKLGVFDRISAAIRGLGFGLVQIEG